jgi:hypothetical protein
MFVRWKKSGKHSFAAVLVESRRVDGKPRQRIVKHLATIYEGDPEDPHGETKPDQFWVHALRGLDEMGEHLTPDDRAVIERALAQRVQRPADDSAVFPMRCRVGRPRRSVPIGSRRAY